MISELKNIQRLTVTEVEGLDTITVYLEELAGADSRSPIGKVTITCHDKAWTASWGSMGTRSVADFLLTSPADYLVNKLGNRHEIHEKAFCGDALDRMAKQVIIDCRRGRTSQHEIGELSRDEARALFDAVSEASIESLHDCWSNHKLLSQLFGDEWFLIVDRADAPNPHYQYLFKIVSAIQQSLSELRQAA